MFNDERKNKKTPVMGNQGLGMNLAQKHADEASFRHEQEFNALIQNNPDIIARFDKEFRYIYVNHILDSGTGILAAAAIGMSIRERGFPEDVVSIYEQALQSVFATGKEKTIEMALGTVGGIRYYESRWVPEFMLDGSIETVLCISRDITDHKQAENKMHEQAALLDLANDAILVRNLGSEIIFWSRGAEQMYGWMKAETTDKITHTLLSTVFPKTREALDETLLTEGQWEGELTHTRRNGDQIIVASNQVLQRDERGQPTGILEINRDITDRKRAEAKLIIANQELVFQNEEKEKRAAELVIANQELVFQNKEKEKRALDLIIANCELEKSKSNISKLNEGLEQKVIERTAQFNTAKLEAERANQAKSEFLSRMSHELRTPLNAILGFSQLLQMDELNADQNGSLDQILRSGHHLLNLINEVLDISRIESGNLSISPEPVQLARALENAVNLIRPLADKRGIAIEIKIPSSRDIFVTSDDQRLKQVLLNLLSNAVKYNRQDGKIFVTASLQMDGYLHLAVRDTGVGIPPEKMDRLFIAFDRLELDPNLVEGTGLGLALSKGLVEAMGGQIGANSLVGEGSTFWINLQLTTQQKEAIIMSEVDDYLKENPTQKKGLVLYVEDNLSNIQLIEKILARMPDVALISAMQGRLALDLARAQQPALILLDLHLPDMHGELVLQNLRADPETKHIPVVIMSADATQHQVEHMLSVGANAYLTKPINVKEFLTMVGEMLAG